MRPFLIICTLATAWFTLALGAMLTGTIATAAVPKGTRIPANVAIVGSAPGLFIVRSDDPDYVRDLYRNGAKLVLPARKKTCLALQG
ncbi:MAG: hypothetical protein ABJN34_06180 [Litoreibacter sp.]|uniref:hypothetical protein n=1 Tax=Litoreibacter sp. TaxID=1969459 RepID=UPI0032968DF1